MTPEEAKRQAALAALSEVSDGMVVGLGTGSTAAIFVAELIARIKRENLKLVAIATSEKTARQAADGGVKLTDFAHHQTIDVTFDGADTVDLKSFAMLKGLGGALLREKIVAQASKRLIIMVDESKVTPRFGGILPVEIVQFAHEATIKRLETLGKVTIRRQKTSPNTFITDNENYIADIDLPEITEPETLQNHIKTIAGVVETGLFIGMADSIIVSGNTGTVVHKRPHA